MCYYVFGRTFYRFVERFVNNLFELCQKKERRRKNEDFVDLDIMIIIFRKKFKCTLDVHVIDRDKLSTEDTVENNLFFKNQIKM